jgi:hypothetical protein
MRMEKPNNTFLSRLGVTQNKISNQN